MRVIDRLLAGGDFPELFGAAALIILIAAVAATAHDYFARLPSPEAASPVRGYELLDRLDCGDLCDVHAAVSGDRRFVLKVPRVVEGNPLLAKEFAVLSQLAASRGDDLCREYLPQPVGSFCEQGRRINSFAWRGGFYTAEQIRQRYLAGVDGRHLAWMFNRTLEALGYVHRQRWIHGAVLPPHLMFHSETHGLQLVGWIHAVRPGTPLRIVPERFKPWYPPECHERKPATPALDIYLAAKSMVWLAGGDPLRDSVPEAVPQPIRRLLKSCLLESPRMRPQDAWSLRAEFAEVLEGVYGPPTYQHLDMS